MKAVFLDRDGVINKYPGDRQYVTSLGKFRFLPRAKKAIALLSKNNFMIFVASNQAGVGKGVYSQKTLDSITARMLSGVEQAGGKITKVYYCTHRKEARCTCRKPKPGLLKKAAKEFKVDLKKVYFVGDTIRDVLTAHAAGAKSILVFSGKEKLSNYRGQSRRAGQSPLGQSPGTGQSPLKRWEAKPDFVFKDLFAAAKFLVSLSGTVPSKKNG
jgi:D-glycero-D-manno-heptose 1,7-bisphosphate phosphatase